MTSVVAAGLKQVPLFSDLSQRQARQLAKHFKERTIPAGVQLTRQGEMSGVAFFVIADGTAAVIVDGERVGTIGPGDHFGELAMITREPRTATITAETPLRCLTIRFWDFREFAKANPDVSWNLLQHLAGLLLDDRARRGQSAPEAG